MSDLALRAEGLGKMYHIGGALQPHATLRDAIVGTVKRPIERIRHPGAATHRSEILWALRDVGFDVKQGEVVGIIGRNGAGKSTLLKLLSRITEPTEGTIELHGRIASLLEVGTGFHPELTGRENIYLNGAILGMRRAEIKSKFDEIVAFAEIAKFLDTPVKRYSSGMYVRLAFSVAAHLEPEILVIDEVLAVGDVAFQRKCLGRMENVAQQGRTVLFVSHNMQAIGSLCTRAIQLEDGRMVNDGDVTAVVERYLKLQSTGGAQASWPTGEGPGDRAARVRGLAIVNEAGEIADIVSSSRPFVVRMDVEVEAPDAALCIGFDLATADGTVLMRTYQTDPPTDEWPALHPGLNRLECVIPEGLLNGGRYLVLPRLSLHYIRWIFRGDESVAFSVHYDHGASPYTQQVRPGVVAPVLIWRAAPVEEI